MASRKDWRFYNRDVVHAKKVMDTHIAWIKSGKLNPNSPTEYQNSIIASERFGAEILRNSQRKPPGKSLPTSSPSLRTPRK